MGFIKHTSIAKRKWNVQYQCSVLSVIAHVRCYRAYAFYLRNARACELRFARYALRLFARFKLRCIKIGQVRFIVRMLVFSRQMITHQNAFLYLLTLRDMGKHSMCSLKHVDIKNYIRNYYLETSIRCTTKWQI